MNDEATKSLTHSLTHSQLTHTLASERAPTHCPRSLTAHSLTAHALPHSSPSLPPNFNSRPPNLRNSQFPKYFPLPEGISERFRGIPLHDDYTAPRPLYYDYIHIQGIEYSLTTTPALRIPFSGYVFTLRRPLRLYPLSGHRTCPREHPCTL